MSAFAWTTESEISFLRNLETAENWGNFLATNTRRRIALENWLETSKIRRWPASFNLEGCRQYAEGCLARLRMKRTA